MQRRHKILRAGSLALCFAWLCWFVYIIAWVIYCWFDLTKASETGFLTSLGAPGWFGLIMTGYLELCAGALWLFVGSGVIRILIRVLMLVLDIKPAITFRRPYPAFEIPALMISISMMVLTLIIGGRIIVGLILAFAAGNDIESGLILIFGIFIGPFIIISIGIVCAICAVTIVLCVPVVRYTCRWIGYTWSCGRCFRDDMNTENDPWLI